MARGTNQKFKLLCLIQLMQRKTDDEHGLTMQQILAELEKQDIKAERKSIYTDFQDMTEKLGMEIIKEQQGRETYYHLGSREFELAEVKLLIDAIQSSKFITRRKSQALIGKIKGFVSEHQAKLLQRQVYINDRVKAMNESVYYNVDDIHTAIAHNRKIRFKYYKWDIHKKLVPRRGGEWFVLSPWALLWDDEYYYMVAYDDWDGKIKHYRVDKMMKLGVEPEKRSGKEAFQSIDLGEYSRSTFGMYNGSRTRVKIHFANHMCGVFLDRFGKDISFRPIDEGSSELNVNIHVSPQFYGWIFSLGKDVRVVGPDRVVEDLKEYTRRFLDNLEAAKRGEE